MSDLQAVTKQRNSEAGGGPTASERRDLSSTRCPDRSADVLALGPRKGPCGELTFAERPEGKERVAVALLRGERLGTKPVLLQRPWRLEPERGAQDGQAERALPSRSPSLRHPVHAAVSTREVAFFKPSSAPLACGRKSCLLHTGVHVLFQVWLPRRACPAVGLLGRKEVFEESPRCSPQWLH